MKQQMKTSVHQNIKNKTVEGKEDFLWEMTIWGRGATRTWWMWMMTYLSNLKESSW
jgi:hypothetical protein